MSAARGRSHHWALQTLSWRAWLLRLFFVGVAASIGLRLWQLQVRDHDLYADAATNQQVRERVLVSKRGTIFAVEKDGQGGTRKVPLAFTRDAWLVFADTRLIRDPQKTAEQLAPILHVSIEELLEPLRKEQDPFEPLKHRVSEESASAIRDLKLPGIQAIVEPERFYPGSDVGSHLVGFVRYEDEAMSGQYGIERSFDTVLAGTSGSVLSERDATGVWIALGERDLAPKTDGSDVVLTIDWTLQYRACRALNEWVKKHGASGGSLIVMDPKTGAIRAMCGAPEFNPNVYNEVASINTFNNPSTFAQYEPGSVFKPITMAAALDQQKVTPETTYEDTGSVTVGPNTIRNSDLKAHGVVTMTEVLKESLNTGAIYAMRQVGREVFHTYVEQFGFGKISGVELPNESAGDISRLDDQNEIYPVTASFGQGVTVTPLQMVSAFAAIANGGTLMRPYIVGEVVRSSGQIEERKPEVVRQVISSKTATLLSGMMVNVVEDGHGKRAAVPGYYIAGKTGTAQIARKDSAGYEEGVTIGTFVGFGPVHNPDFAMLVKVDRPRDVQFAESSAAPLFGEIAKFILQYDEVPPERSVQ